MTYLPALNLQEQQGNITTGSSLKPESIYIAQGFEKGVHSIRREKPLKQQKHKAISQIFTIQRNLTDLHIVSQL